MNVPRAFDGKLSARRSYAYCSLPLADLKAIGKAHGATVNDMLLTVLDTAMQHYLARHDPGARAPLVADMPVALAEGAKGVKGGNQIAVLQFPLGQAAASVGERLRAIRSETARLKAALGKRGSDTVMLYTTLVHAVALLVERVAERGAPRLSNLLISNPFGFAHDAYLMGARVELALPVSVVAAGHKLSVTAVTLGPRLQIGFLAMPEAVPHIEQLARLTEQAFDEVKAALLPAIEAVPPPVASKRRTVARKTAAPRAPREPAASARKTPAKAAPRRAGSRQRIAAT